MDTLRVKRGSGTSQSRPFRNGILGGSPVVIGERMGVNWGQRGSGETGKGVGRRRITGVCRRCH